MSGGRPAISKVYLYKHADKRLVEKPPGL